MLQVDLNYFAVQQKLTQHSQSTILNKINFSKDWLCPKFPKCKKETRWILLFGRVTFLWVQGPLSLRNLNGKAEEAWEGRGTKVNKYPSVRWTKKWNIVTARFHFVNENFSKFYNWSFTLQALTEYFKLDFLQSHAKEVHKKDCSQTRAEPYNTTQTLHYFFIFHLSLTTSRENNFFLIAFSFTTWSTTQWCNFQNWSRSNNR